MRKPLKNRGFNLLNFVFLVKNYFVMKLEDVNIKTILAIFIIVFGMVSLVFVHMEDMVLGAIIGFIGFPLGYYFGSSKSSESKYKTISDMSKNAVADDIVGDRPKDRG